MSLPRYHGRSLSIRVVPDLPSNHCPLPRACSFARSLVYPSTWVSFTISTRRQHGRHKLRAQVLVTGRKSRINVQDGSRVRHQHLPFSSRPLSASLVMSTAIASAVVAPLPPLDRNPSPRSYPPLAPSTNALPKERNLDQAVSSEMNSSMNPNERTPSDGKRSPRS